MNNEVSLDLNYFNSNTSTLNNNSYSLSFDTNSLQGQPSKQIKPIAKPNFAGMNKKEPTFDFNLGNNLSTGYGSLGSSFGSNLNSNDPFAELDTAYGIQPNFLAKTNSSLNTGNSSFNVF